MVIHHAARFSSSAYTGDLKKIPDVVPGTAGTSRLKKQLSSKIEDKSGKEVTQKGKSLALLFFLLFFIFFFLFL